MFFFWEENYFWTYNKIFMAIIKHLFYSREISHVALTACHAYGLFTGAYLSLQVNIILYFR